MRDERRRQPVLEWRVRFLLGTHVPTWLSKEPELFISRRRLTDRKTFPAAVGRWALDSGGFTELNMFGGWQTTEDEYVDDVELFAREVGGMDWVAPMDWMCEPIMLEKTGKTIAEHQELTVDNFLRLRERLGMLVIPVLQGWDMDDYKTCWALYEIAGVQLQREPLVGVGSVCRRQGTQEIAKIFRYLADGGLSLHGFGVKTGGLSVYADALSSADSLAWSYQARRSNPLPACTHRNCANCIRYARRWRDRVVNDILGQTRLEFA